MATVKPATKAKQNGGARKRRRFYIN